jgi:membrane fusion protein (multidrug efflux system)
MNRITIIAIVAITFAACGRHKPVDMTAENKPAKASYETVQVEKTSITSAIKIPGELKPWEKVDIYPKMNGFVKDMYVDRGSIVHKGQLLMTLEAPELAQQMQAAQGRLLESQENINASRDRYFRLLSASKVPGSVSDMDLTNAQAKYQSDSAMVASQKANLRATQTLEDYLIVRSPFDGVITERNIHPGALTGPNFKIDNKPLLVLEDNTVLRLETFIPEVYVGSIDMSDKKISFTTDALPGQTFSAPLARSSESLYDQYRSEAVEADVSNPNGIFKAGMYVEASIKIKSPVTSFVVPTSSIITTTEGKYIIAIENSKTKYMYIKEGIASNGKAEIFGVLTGNEVILKKPSNEIKEGVEIK